MIKDNQRYFNRLHFLLDVLVIVGSYMLAWYLKFQTEFFDHIGDRLSFEKYMFALWGIVPGYLLLYLAFHMYTSKRVQGRRLEIGNIIKANILGVLGFITLLYVIGQHDFSREMVVIFFVINVMAEVALRMFIRYVLRMMRKKGFNIKHILLVGYSRASEAYIDRMAAFPQWGYHVVGILDDNVEAGTNYNGTNVIGKIDLLEKMLAENTLDEVAITLGLSEYSKLEKLVGICEKSGVHTQFVPDYNNIIPSRPYTEDLMGLPVVNIRYVPLSNTFNAFVKRVIDIIGSAVGIVVISPLLLIISILVKCTSKGPLIFRQERVGLHNETFMMYKFRTIEMSLVGPRPERPFFVEQFKEQIPRYMVKHQVRPGLTGWAQINGYRGDTDIRKRIDCDLYYIENWTFGLDIKIMFLTIFKGFVNKNAY